VTLTACLDSVCWKLTHVGQGRGMMPREKFLNKLNRLFFQRRLSGLQGHFFFRILVRTTPLQEENANLS
jgi:hypothetical protein